LTIALDRGRCLREVEVVPRDLHRHARLDVALRALERPQRVELVLAV
jgi:hypothetical protein